MLEMVDLAVLVLGRAAVAAGLLALTIWLLALFCEQFWRLIRVHAYFVRFIVYMRLKDDRVKFWDHVDQQQREVDERVKTGSVNNEIVWACARLTKPPAYDYFGTGRKNFKGLDPELDADIDKINALFEKRKECD